MVEPEQLDNGLDQQFPVVTVSLQSQVVVVSLRKYSVD
jgi:hypothetical protein